jgi:ubiquinone/menaquinone biosynthesis C-methylase UbiE
MSQQAPDVSPLRFLDTVNAHQRTQAMKGALELDIFTAIGEGKQTAHDLAERCGASDRGIRILCDYVTAMEFLKKKDDHYELTPDSAMFLDKRSPAFMGSIIDFLLSPMLTGGFEDVAGAVRKGGTILPGEGAIAPEHPVWVKFARAMAPMMAPAAEAIPRLIKGPAERRIKVLDIAAGHGMFGITVARHNPNAEIFALDWPNVLEVARENAQKAGISERYHTISGSAFEVDYGVGYDLVLLTNFLHHFDVATCEALLRKIHASLNQDGQVITVEFVPNEDRVSPPPAAMFSLIMLCTTPSGDAYTFSELARMFKNAGFSASELHSLPPSPNQAVVSLK